MIRDFTILALAAFLIAGALIFVLAIGVALRESRL